MRNRNMDQKKNGTFLALFILVLIFLKGFALSEVWSPIESEMIALDDLVTGRQSRVSFEIRGGSGHYSNRTIEVGSIIRINGTGSWLDVGSVYSLDSDSGTLLIDCPAATEVAFCIQCDDDITGEHYMNYHFLALEQNPDFPVVLQWTEEEYYYGETLAVSYLIGGDVTSFKEARIVWGYIDNNGNPQFPKEEAISTVSGSTSFTPISGREFFVYLQAEDSNGNIIFGQSEPVNMAQVAIQQLPDSLIMIEDEAFAGTSITAVEVPASVTFIASDAFIDSETSVFVGHNDYVKQYANQHGIRYIDR